MNNKKTLDFTDIECVNIRVIYDNDGADVYRLSLSLKRGGRFFIESSTDGNEVFEISEAVADIIITEVKMA
ncbi:hypothetical protein OAG1_03750 [Agarivorans sp. OAG1]|nr:hypothetical protein OAG1_03750 [Agarivorans sp. OAG1]